MAWFPSPDLYLNLAGWLFMFIQRLQYSKSVSTLLVYQVWIVVFGKKLSEMSSKLINPLG